MDVKEALLKRRSVRKFTEEAVSCEDINQLLHRAMAAPSASNKTPWEFFVVTNGEKLNNLKASTKYTNITAPLAIVVCGNLSRALPDYLAEYWIQDCSAATENILLRAVELDLGCVWCGIHPQKDGVENVRRELELGENLIPLNIIYIGHPAKVPRPNDQYNEEYVHFVK